ncbi:MAG: hypothetical protein ACE5Q6_03600 [Dehalococcoidia bacterium]
MSGEIVVRPGGNFSVNGKIAGPLQAFFIADDKAERFLWGGDTNWSKTEAQEKAARDLVTRTKLRVGIDITEESALDLILEAMDRALKEASEQRQSADGVGDTAKKSQSTRLVELALEQDCDLWHSPEQTGYATICVEGHRETWPINTKPFRQWLSYLFYQQEGKSPGSQAIQDTLAVLSGKAVFEGPEFTVYVRIAEVDGTIYLDLCNDDWQCIKVTDAGWEIISESPARFKRSRGMLPLPIPTRGGDLDKLRAMLNIGDAGSDSWALFLGCLVQALRGQGPYPILILYGEHGAAKSTASRVFRRLIDPNQAELRSPPKDERDLTIQAGNGWILAYDNLSYLPEWLSNALCRLSTGGGMGTRELFSDDDERIFSAQRPAVLNGIEEISNRPDLMDRGVLQILQPIPEKSRKRETQFWREFNDIHPELLGRLLDAVVVGLQRMDTIQLEALPRMADFAVWATAAEPGLGLQPGTFMAAYTRNRGQLNQSTLDSSPIAEHITKLMESQAEWRGTFSDLLREVDGIASEKDRGAKSWPTRANTLSNRVRAIAPNLRAGGIEVILEDGTQGVEKGKTIITLKSKPPENELGNRPNHPNHRNQSESSGSAGSAGSDDFSTHSKCMCREPLPPTEELGLCPACEQDAWCSSCGGCRRCWVSA